MVNLEVDVVQSLPTVHEVEVRIVDIVLCHVLQGGRELAAIHNGAAEVIVGRFGDTGYLVGRICSTGVVPEQHHVVDLAYRVAAHTGPRRNTCIAVRDTDTGTGLLEGPTVIRTGQCGTLDRSTAQVASEVRAVGVQHTKGTLRSAVQHEFAGRRDGREHVAGTQVVAGCQRVPAVGYRRRRRTILQFVGKVRVLQGHTGVR